MAKVDLGSVIGPRGERGSIIYQGTSITGTETKGTVFAESGIDYALQEDKYLNTLTNDMYTCIMEGDADTAEWAWIGNIQGKQGIPGEPGPTGKVDETTPIEFEKYQTRDNLESGDSLAVLMGKTQKHFADMSESAYLPVVNDLETARAGEGVLDAYQGKVLSEKIDEYTSDYFSPAKSYEVGDVCIYNNKLYKFKSKKESGEWNEDAVEITNLGNYVSELNSNLTWKEVGTISGSKDPIALPSDFNELNIVLVRTSDLNGRGFSFHLTRRDVERHHYYIQGFYGSPTSFGVVGINVTTSSVSIGEASGQTGDIINSTAIYVEYR